MPKLIGKLNSVILAARNANNRIESSLNVLGLEKEVHVSQKKVNIFASIIFLIIFSLLTTQGFIYDYTQRGPAAVRGLAIFLCLFVLVFVFMFIAKWQLSPTDKSLDEEKSMDEDSEKGMWSRIIDQENAYVNIIAKTSFHILPLYLTLVVIRMDLFIAYKIVIVIFLDCVYAFVELRYIADKIWSLALEIIKKTKLHSWFAMFIAGIGFLVVFSVAVIYFAYNLVMFYYKRFP